MHVLTLLLLSAGWTLAWLYWWFRSPLPGKVVYYLFPTKWLSKESREGVDEQYTEELITTLALSRAPMFIVQLLACRYCLAAHFSLWSLPFVTLLLLGLPVLHIVALVPLLWASSAATALTIYKLLYNAED